MTRARTERAETSELLVRHKLGQLYEYVALGSSHTALLVLLCRTAVTKVRMQTTASVIKRLQNHFTIRICQERGGQQDPNTQPIDWLITGLAFVFPALGGALFGYDIGATSGALVSIKNATTSGTDWYHPHALKFRRLSSTVSVQM